MKRIAMVSNRLPALNGQAPRAGGLETALKSVLAEAGGLWLGWNGEVEPAREPALRVVPAQDNAFELAGLSLSEAEHRGFYLGFANGSLWPLLHGHMDRFRYASEDYASYAAVNRRFARALAEQADRVDLVWVHDYHLIPLGQELRSLGMRQPIGFFLHIPFPPPDTLALIPCHLELLQALTAYDLVGFQTEHDLRNFRDCLGRFLGGGASADGGILVGDRRFHAGAFPIGIDTRRFEELAASAGVEKLCTQLRQRLGEIAAVGVERLDYTKGLPQRLHAFERFLEIAPNYRRQVVLLQVAAPSREEVPQYLALREELEALTGQINARWGDMDWMPVHYMNRAFSQTRLAALYRLSRIGLVTPLRDGMNLVAKEYVAAQQPDNPGVLVLSEFAGAAERLQAAVLVNPFDTEAMAVAIRDSIAMPLGERRRRWSTLLAEIRTHDVHHWRDSFLSALTAPRDGVLLRRLEASAFRPGNHGPRPAAAGRAAGGGRDSLHRRRPSGRDELR